MKLTAEQALKRLSAACARREMCQQDALRKLSLWQVPEEERDAIVSKLIEYGFIDEHRYAAAYAEDKLKYNGWGARKVRMMLRSKGIDDDIVEEAIDQSATIEGQQELLLRLLSDKARSLKNEENPYKKEQKLIRFALSRGFDYDDAKSVIDNLGS